MYMPYIIRKTRKKNCYSVMNKRTKHKFAKCSSLENAKKQLRLLRALQFNKNFKPNSNKNKTQKRRT